MTRFSQLPTKPTNFERFFLEFAPPNQDALRGLLSARFTAVELFRSATAESSEYNATVGMDDLDELLLRSNLTLPLEVGF